MIAIMQSLIQSARMPLVFSSYEGYGDALCLSISFPMALNIKGLWRMCDCIYNTHPQLRVSQLRFLIYVKQHPSQSLTEISIGLGQTLPAISRAIDVFGMPRKGRTRDLSLGYVSAERNPMDDRVITVKLTLKGEHFFDQLKLNYEHL